MTLARRPASWLFVVIAVLIYSTIYLITRTPQGISHTALMSAAALFDLSLTTSFAFYILLVRNGYCSWRAMAAVGLVGLRAAGLLLPEVDQPYLPSLRWISVLLEGILIVAILRRLRRVPSSNNVLTRIRNATSAVIPQQRLAKLIAAEVAVLYYALFSWRAKPETEPGSRAFSCAEASGYRLLGTLLMLLIAFEGVPLHFLLWRYSAAAAWIWTALDAYGLLWLLAITRSMHLRPILVDEKSVKIRIGIIWEAEILKQNIASYRHITPGMAPVKTPNYLKAVVLNDPQYILELKQPAIAVGLHGQHRTFMQIGLAVDRGEAFLSAITLEN